MTQQKLQNPPNQAPARSRTSGSWGGSGGQDPPGTENDGAHRTRRPLKAKSSIAKMRVESIMNHEGLTVRFVSICILSLLPLAGCGSARASAADAAAEAPPPTKVVQDMDVTLFRVDHPEQFPIASAVAHPAAHELTVTGSVSPDVSRSVPVVSIATGRVVAVSARLGDTVKKGQPLFSLLSDDVAGGFSDYQKSVNDEALARIQLERATGLYDHGAISLNDLQVAQNTETKAKLDAETKAEHLRLLGNNPDRQKGFVQIVTAPVAGVITDQQVTKDAAVQGMGSTPFTISDLSHVWIVCDVYENDLPFVHIGDGAEVHLNAYPDQAFKGTISNIGAILDSNIRTAKVRVEVDNPGLMHLGMFATATFRSQNQEAHTAVPASAILHLHDRDWMYLPAPDRRFRRVEVVSGSPMPDGMQEIKSGIEPGQQVVADVLVLDHVIAQ